MACRTAQKDHFWSVGENVTLTRRARSIIGALALVPVGLLLGCGHAQSPTAVPTSTAAAGRTATLVLRPLAAISAASLRVTADIVRQRLAAVNVPADVSTANGTLVIKVAPGSLAEAESLGRAQGVLRIRQALEERAGSHAGEQRARTELKTLTAAQAAFAAFACPAKVKPLDGPDDYLVACSADNTTQYLLAPAAVEGTEIKSASVDLPQNSISGNDWQIDLSFKSKGTNQFATFTARLAQLPQPPYCSPPTGCNGAAIALDGVVESAPFIDPQSSPNGILGGNATISGTFTQRKARDLAAELRYGALPEQFVPVSTAASG